MPATLSPYLNFDGNAREAMEFYRDIFGGELRTFTYGESGTASDPSENDRIMHADLTSDGIHFMASDVPSAMGLQRGSMVKMSLNGGPEEDAALRRAFERLADGGSVTIPLAAAPWGDAFGMLTDRFGIEWMVNILPAGRAEA